MTYEADTCPQGRCRYLAIWCGRRATVYRCSRCGHMSDDKSRVTDGSCHCSEYQSSGMPCPPGRCPNNPNNQEHADEQHLARQLLQALDQRCPLTPLALTPSQEKTLQRILRLFGDAHAERVQKEALRASLEELTAHVHAARAAIAGLCDLTDADAADMSLAELVKTAELECNAEHERALAAEAKVAEQAEQILVLQHMDRPPMGSTDSRREVLRDEWVHALRRVARDPGVHTTTGALLAIADILENP